VLYLIVLSDAKITQCQWYMNVQALVGKLAYLEGNVAFRSGMLQPTM